VEKEQVLWLLEASSLEPLASSMEEKKRLSEVSLVGGYETFPVVVR
jgi:hypothetical protein